MAVGERSHDPRRLLFEVYDDHQPATRADVSSEEALATRPSIRLAVVWSCNGCEHLVEILGELGMMLRGDDVLRPRVFKEDYTDAIRSGHLGSYGALGPARASTASA
jgi:hypothetical protein